MFSQLAVPSNPKKTMSNAAYSDYTAHIHEGAEAAAAHAKGERLKGAFPGANYDLVAGDPPAKCTDVTGPDPEKVKQIRIWINTTE